MRLLQGGDVDAGKHPVGPLELRVVDHLLLRVITLKEVYVVPLLAAAKRGGGSP